MSQKEKAQIENTYSCVPNKRTGRNKSTEWKILKKIKEKKVLVAELSSLKKNAKVYKKQQNSNIHFLADKEKVFKECKGTLDDLIAEYKVAEELPQENQPAEEED